MLGFKVQHFNKRKGLISLFRQVRPGKCTKNKNKALFIEEHQV